MMWESNTPQQARLRGTNKVTLSFAVSHMSLRFKALNETGTVLGRRDT